MCNNNKNIVVECPHCKIPVIIDKLNCAIFRHAVYKKNNKFINPHTGLKTMNSLMKKNLLYGCGNPFKIIIGEDNKIEVEKCDYI